MVKLTALQTVAVLIECSQHLKSLSVVHGTFVFKEKTEGFLLNSNLDLALPISTSFGIFGVSDESIIQTKSGELGTT